MRTNHRYRICGTRCYQQGFLKQQLVRENETKYGHREKESIKRSKWKF
jgi:hypothetical protein